MSVNPSDTDSGEPDSSDFGLALVEDDSTVGTRAATEHDRQQLRWASRRRAAFFYGLSLAVLAA